MCALLTIPEVLPNRDFSDVTLVSEDSVRSTGVQVDSCTGFQVYIRTGVKVQVYTVYHTGLHAYMHTGAKVNPHQGKVLG